MECHERIKQVRKERSISKKDIGALLKKSCEEYDKIEKGLIKLKMSELMVLCRFYNLSSDYLSGLCDTPRKLRE